MKWIWRQSMHHGIIKYEESFVQVSGFLPGAFFYALRLDGLQNPLSMNRKYLLGKDRRCFYGGVRNLVF